MSTAPRAAPVSVFAPATVSNVACGFDVFGFAVRGLGDTVTAAMSSEPGVGPIRIAGDGGRLATDSARNTAGVAARAVLSRLDRQGRRGLGVHLSLHKGMPLASGLGSSAASAVAAAVAVDRLLDARLADNEVLACALEGELLASGSLHADNVAPCLFGGLVLVRALEPVPDVVTLPVPRALFCAIVRPHLEVETLAARSVLGEHVRLRDAVRQWGNTAALVAALFREDLELLSRALEDRVAEPKRAQLVPGFHRVKEAALASGALGCSLSGSGPSIFALCRDASSAKRVVEGMAGAFAAEGIGCDPLVSPVGTEGAHRVDGVQAGVEPGADSAGAPDRPVSAPLERS